MASEPTEKQRAELITLLGKWIKTGDARTDPESLAGYVLYTLRLAFHPDSQSAWIVDGKGTRVMPWTAKPIVTPVLKTGTLRVPCPRALSFLRLRLAFHGHCMSLRTSRHPGPDLAWIRWLPSRAQSHHSDFSSRWIASEQPNDPLTIMRISETALPSNRTQNKLEPTRWVANANASPCLTEVPVT
jgi:hypothetical protein